MKRPSGISNATWGVTARVVQTVLTLICSPFIIGWFGPRTYGLLALGLMTIGVLGFADLGLTAASTRELAVADGTGNTAEARRIFATVQTVYLVLAFVVGGGVALVAPLLADRIFSLGGDQIDDGLFVLRMAGVGLGLNLLTAPLMSVPRALQRFDKTTQIAVGLSLFATAGLLVCAWQHSLRAAVLWQLTSTLLNLFLLWRLARKLRPDWLVLPGFHRATFAVLASFASFQFLNQVMGSLAAQADRILVAAYLPTEDVTYYQVTSGISQKIHVIVAAAAAFVFPRVAQLVGEQDMAGVRSLYQQGLRFTMLAAGLLAGPTIAAAAAFLSGWMGDDFSAHATTNLRYSTAAWMMFCGTVMPVLTLLGMGRARAVTLILGAISLSGVALAWWLVQTIGRDGAAMAMMFSMGLSPLMLLWVHSEVGGETLDAIISLGRVILPAMVAWGITSAVVAVVPPVLPLVLLAMATGAVVGLATWRWVPGLAGPDGSVLDEVARGARRRLKKFMPAGSDKNGGS